MVGAIQGRSGKTTVTLGLLKALTDKGYHIQPFKKGADYIDSSWMTYTTGVPCRNLDLFMMTKSQIQSSFFQHSQGYDLSVVEGAMGLFDGTDVEGTNSSAELAYTLGLPVLLVVNCTRITRSVAALVNGCVTFDPRIRIGGVILNQVARARHEDIMIQSIERYCNVPVLGTLPKSKQIEIPDRHLGLIPAGEQDMLRQRIQQLGDLVQQNVNLDGILNMARQAQPMEVAAEKAIEIHKVTEEPVAVGYLKDRAFSFYYPENLEALEEAGAKLVPVDSMADSSLPEINALYIGGGFPEMMAEEISANQSLMNAIREKAEEGMPIYAECGGLMYLSDSILYQGKKYPMVGLFHGEIEMKDKLQGHGYTIQESCAENPFFTPGQQIQGHEFHNSVMTKVPEDATYGFHTLRGKGIYEKQEGLLYKNTVAAYHHLHVYSAPNWAENLIKLACDYPHK